VAAVVWSYSRSTKPVLRPPVAVGRYTSIDLGCIDSGQSKLPVGGHLPPR